MAKIDELREEQEGLLLKKSVIEALLASVGWKLFDAELIASTRAYRQEDFANGLASIDSAFQSAGLRGVIEGLVRARAKPHQMLDDVVTDLVNIATEIEEMRRDEE